jgi:hypothetical protein
MRISSPLSNLHLRRRPQPGIQVIDELLDTLPQAALLIDAQENCLLAANSKLVEMTAIPSRELTDLDLGQLFANLEKTLFCPGNEERSRQFELQLKKRGGALLEVRAEQTCLDAKGRWSLVTLEPLSLHDQRQAEFRRQGQIWQALAALAAAPQEGELLDAIQAALEAGSQLTGASSLVVYQVDGQSYTLKRLAVKGASEFLPEEIHPQDVVPLQTPNLWTPGKRSQSSLHRAARASNLSFLASVPLGNRKPWSACWLLLETR